MTDFIAYGDEGERREGRASEDAKWSVVGQTDEERRTNQILQDVINKHQYDRKAYMKEARYWGISTNEAQAFYDDVMMRLDAGGGNGGGLGALLSVVSWFVIPVAIVALTVYLLLWPRVAAVLGQVP
jgi:hypothetical protein